MKLRYTALAVCLALFIARTHARLLVIEQHYDGPLLVQHDVAGAYNEEDSDDFVVPPIVVQPSLLSRIPTASSSLVHPLSWLRHQLELLQGLQPDLWLSSQQADQPNPQELLRHVGCSRFQQAMKEYQEMSQMRADQATVVEVQDDILLEDDDDEGDDDEYYDDSSFQADIEDLLIQQEADRLFDLMDAAYDSLYDDEPDVDAGADADDAGAAGEESEAAAASDDSDSFTTEMDSPLEAAARQAEVNAMMVMAQRQQQMMARQQHQQQADSLMDMLVAYMSLPFRAGPASGAVVVVQPSEAADEQQQLAQEDPLAGAGNGADDHDGLVDMVAAFLSMPSTTTTTSTATVVVPPTDPTAAHQQQASASTGAEADPYAWDPATLLLPSGYTADAIDWSLVSAGGEINWGALMLLALLLATCAMAAGFAYSWLQLRAAMRGEEGGSSGVVLPVVFRDERGRVAHGYVLVPEALGGDRSTAAALVSGGAMLLPGTTVVHAGSSDDDEDPKKQQQRLCAAVGGKQEQQQESVGVVSAAAVAAEEGDSLTAPLLPRSA